MRTAIQLADKPWGIPSAARVMEFAACGRVVPYLTGRCEHLRAFTREQLAEARLLAGPLLMQSRLGILPPITGEKGADLASFYVYYTEVGIIMRAIRRIHDRGHLVLECLAPWSGHEVIGTYAATFARSANSSAKRALVPTSSPDEQWREI